MRCLTLTTPYMHGPEVALWQRFLASRGLYAGPINGEFDNRTCAATVEYQEQTGLEANSLVDEKTVDRAGRDGFVPPSDKPDREHFRTIGHVALSSHAHSLLTGIAYHYYLWTGEDLTATSGTRTPREQARAMYDNLYHGRNRETHYRKHQAYQEILNAYNEARRSGANERATIDAMTRIIEAQVARHIYISRDLQGEAVDVRSRAMSSQQRSAFEESVHDVLGHRPIAEGDPYHLEF
jgi:peptidoglycan hydrolase-like protein with peptidoglycan-binding domain